MMKLALPSLLAATVALTGCGGFAGTSPDGVGPLAAPAPLVPAAPADATFRLTGVASLNDRAFAGASLRLFDVLTDEEFVLSDRSQSLAGAGGIVSTSNGGFDVETFIPGLIPNGAGGLISNQAGGLISNQAGGLISNQAGGLISNQAGGLISNQAGGLISNQAGGLISNQAGGLISNVPGGANLSDVALRAFRLVAEKDGQALVTVVDGLGQGLSEGGAAGYRLQQAGGTILVELSPATTAVAKAFEGALKLQFELAEPGARAAGLSEVFVQARQATRAVRAQLRKDPDLARRIAAAVDARGALRDVQAFQRSAAEGQLDRELAPRVVEVLNAFVARKGSQGGAGEARGGGPRLDGRDFPLGDVTVERGGVVVVKAKNGDTVRIDRPVPGREAGAAKPSDKAPVARNARPAAGTGGNNGNGNAGGGADNGNGNAGGNNGNGNASGNNGNGNASGNNGNGNAGGNNGNGNAGGNNGNGNAGGNTGNAGGGTDNGNAGGNIGNGNAGGGADNGNAGGSNGNGNAGGGTGNGNGSGGNGGGNGNGNG